MIVEKKLLSDFINNEYKEFSMYTIENRAIPSAIDGMKPVQRKLLYAMIVEHHGKKVKMSDLGGISKYGYHHGESSAIGAAVGMAQSWNNNVPLFTSHGNFGSRLVQEAAAPRYIFASLSENFKKYFVHSDVAPTGDDADTPEPIHYLPIIPWVLINGISGIAVGFKTEILPRSVKDVTEAVKACLKDPDKYLKMNKAISPTFPSFTGKVEHVVDNQWKTIGKIEYVGKNQFLISELPIGYDRESYVTLLNNMLDDDKIRDYEDECSKSGFGFRIKVSLDQKAAAEKDPIKYFKLERTHTEILTTLDHLGKLKIFQTVAELVHYFVSYRLTKFNDKIEFDKKNLLDAIQEMMDKAKFIRHVIDGKVDFRKTTKAELIDYIRVNITDKEYGKSFINIALYNCTADSIETLKTKILEQKEEHTRLLKITPEDFYQSFLK